MRRNRERNYARGGTAPPNLPRLRFALHEPPVAAGGKEGAVPGLAVAAGPMDGEPVHARGGAETEQHPRIARRQVAAARPDVARQLLSLYLGHQADRGEVAIFLALQLDA